MTGTLNTRLNRALAGMLLAGFALAAAPLASAEQGVVHVARTYALTYNLDLTRPQSRQALLASIENAAKEYCDRPMTRSDREACARNTTEKSIQNASDGVRFAMTLAQNERAATLLASR